MSTLNWGDLVKDAGDVGSYDPLPDGDYDLTVVEATAKVSQSGKTMFAIKAQVQSVSFGTTSLFQLIIQQHSESSSAR